MAQENKNVMEKLPDLEANGTIGDSTIEFPTGDNDIFEVGKIEFTSDKNKKRYKFKIPSDATPDKMVQLFNSLMTFHVDEDHAGYALAKKWGWKIVEDKDGESLTT